MAEAFDPNAQTPLKQQESSVLDPAKAATDPNSSVNKNPLGNPDQTEKALTAATAPEEHDHAGNIDKPEFHLDPSKLDGARGLGANLTKLTSHDFGANGDLLNGKNGNNVMIGSGGNDIFKGRDGRQTITTGGGKDGIVLKKETTNTIQDFDPTQDRFILEGIDPRNLVIGQGKNPGKGGLNQPTDSKDTALVIDKQGNHILAEIKFTKASALTDKNFVLGTPKFEADIRQKSQGFNKQRGDGQLNGTTGHDKLVGGEGDDFLYVGDDSVKINVANAKANSGAEEFPFPNDSPGRTAFENIEFSDGKLKLNGKYENFNAFPLFSQGETTIDPNAKILNGQSPEEFIKGFNLLEDSEGNARTGSHLHFSPSRDSRGNFADATVVRYFTENIIDSKSGKISGEFELTPEEQAAFLAGNLYLNIHTNKSDNGKPGFATGENRVNFNQNVVSLA